MEASVPPDTEFAALVHAIYLLSPDAIGVSLEGRHVLVNPRYLELFDYEREEQLIGRPILDLIAEESRPLVREYVRRRAAGEAVPARYEVRGLRRDGSAFDMDVRASAYDLGGRVHTLVILRDVTERKEAERALRESQEFYRALFDVNSAVKLLIEPGSGRIVDANAAAVAFYGWTLDELRQRRIQEINVLDADEIRRELDAARRGRRQHFLFQHRVASGAVRDVEVYTGPVELRGGVHLLSIIHDVTERRALEARLRQSQKMEAVGRLAGGVAHDFNNLLTVMLGYGEMALDEVPPGSPLARQIDGMLQAATRARDLTRQLLAFSRRQVLQPRVLDLNAVVRAIEGLLRRTVGPGVEVRVELAEELPPTLADAGQLDQVVLNLALNARDAMPEGGRMILRTRERDVAPGDPLRPPGWWVALEVEDTGIGMDATTQARLFEPFFTTKPEGEGTGLGLATVYGIVTQSGGHVVVDSAPGRGSRFEVLLPIAPDTEPTDPFILLPLERPPAARVLLVEDEDEIRSLFAEVLERDGFRVTTAPDAAVAFELFRADPHGFDVLVSDVVMPGQSGVALARDVLAFRPDLPVLLVSGDVRANADLRLEGRVSFLQKPFAGKALLRRVGELLAKPGPDPQTDDLL